MPVPIKALKPVVFLLCLVPLAALIWAILYDPESFSANPLEDITDRTGLWTLRLIVITLAVSPLRQISGWNSVIRFRRMLGLFAFFYGFLHFTTYVWFTVFFDIPTIVEDVLKRPFITVGFVAFVLMIPLALTSTKKWIARLGGKKWQFLHKAIYLTGILGVIHYIWRMKSDIQDPLVYAVLLVLLLGFRLWHRFRTVTVVG
jgi:methionine sulfoxide reductase heme-binding subunit